MHAPAFGRPVTTGSNLARIIRLARMAGATIVPAYAVRTGGARFTVQFMQPLRPRKTADRVADLQANMAALDAAVSRPVLAHIDQWFMLPDFRMDR